MAYNIDMVQRFDPEKSNDSLDLMKELGDDLYKLMNGDLSDNNEEGGGEVLPDSQIKSYLYYRKGKNGDGKPDSGQAYEPRDYYDVPPDAYIAALRQKYTVSLGVNAVNDSKLRLAEMLMMKYQIRRDRTFGFRPSPFFGHYAVTRPGKKDGVRAFPTACDPNELLSLGIPTDPTTDLARQRLGLSRLCGALNIPQNYNISTSFDKNAPARPVVMPKFPALYYLFPEQKHNLDGTSAINLKMEPGTKVPTKVDEYDTRQPTAALTDEARVDVLFVDNTLRPDKNFTEPYVSVLYNKSALGSYEFLPVQPTTPSPTRKPAPSRYYNDTIGALPYEDTIGALPTIAQLYNLTGIPPIAEDLRLAGTQADTLKAATPATNRSPFPLAETAVNLVAVQPRQLNGFPASVAGFSYETWKLPAKTDVVGTSASNETNVPTNIIEVPTRSGRFNIAQVPYAVPFLERAIFDGRQLMLTRVMDMDLGLMRSEKIEGGQYNEPVLPMSGIVFAFREDAVREDAIARPADTSGNNRMSAIDPRNPKDPRVVVDTSQGLIGISTKPVDDTPDPERRVHAFRLRNGSQIKRNRNFESGSFSATDNYRGLSIFTDQPLYIQGDLNLHQRGEDDTVGTPLEEFRGPNAMIRGTTFDENKFYKRGTPFNGEKDPDFAQPDKDRWRPTELLADSISILSDNFCDGSSSDLFVNYDRKDYAQGKQHPFSNSNGGAAGTFDRGIYHDSGSGFRNTGLSSAGCSTVGTNKTNNESGYTSFRNSDQPFSDLPTASGGRFDWLRENSNPTSYSENLRVATEYDGSTAPAGDYMSPVKISRSGLPILREPLRATPITGCPDIGPKLLCNPTPGTRLYGDSVDTQMRNLVFRPIGTGNNNRKPYLMEATPTNINSIVVSGIVPSIPGRSYGGLHNFPRFSEAWKVGGGDPISLDYSGSFLQLSFSNYATAPWEMKGWEYDNAGTLLPVVSGAEAIQFYDPPLRSWGYDVALQLAAAGPAASRFVINTPSRNEFYSEPQINDPYIKTLCRAAKATNVKGSVNLNCDT